MSTYQPKETLRSLSEDDRPREKAAIKGIGQLSDSELIAILLGSGHGNMNAISLARQILQSVQQDLHALAKLSITELQRHKGVGLAKAVTISAAMELGRRRWTREAIQKTDVRSSADAFAHLKPALIDKRHEEFWILLLNQACKVLHMQIASTGGVAHVPVDIKIILKAAVDHQATQLILAHNHPSGRLQASQADIQLTDRLVQAARLIDLKVIDHLIISDNGYFSFADEGMI